MVSDIVAKVDALKSAWAAYQTRAARDAASE
jgi:hypothetical protein